MISWFSSHLNFHKCRPLKIVRLARAVLTRDLLAKESQHCVLCSSIDWENFGIFPYSRCMAYIIVALCFHGQWMSLVVFDFDHVGIYCLTLQRVVFLRILCPTGSETSWNIWYVPPRKALLLFPCYHCHKVMNSKHEADCTVEGKRETMWNISGRVWHSEFFNPSSNSM